jgi:hypothetical protein
MEGKYDKILQTGVNENSVKQSSKNEKLMEEWLKIIQISEVKLPCDKKIGNLF